MDEHATERIADQATAQRIIGACIREFREAAGISQTELARRVYVSRQTVGNWESGRTLADVQSLVLLSQVFGTTVDELIGDKGARAVRSTANDRHELLRLLAFCAALLVICIALVFVRYMLSRAGYVMGADGRPVEAEPSPASVVAEVAEKHLCARLFPPGRQALSAREALHEPGADLRGQLAPKRSRNLAGHEERHQASRVHRACHTCL